MDNNFCLMRKWQVVRKPQHRHYSLSGIYISSWKKYLSISENLYSRFKNIDSLCIVYLICVDIKKKMKKKSKKILCHFIFHVNASEFSPVSNNKRLSFSFLFFRKLHFAWFYFSIFRHPSHFEINRSSISFLHLVVLLYK